MESLSLGAKNGRKTGMKLSTALSVAEESGGPGSTQRRKLQTDLSYPETLKSLIILSLAEMIQRTFSRWPGSLRKFA